MDEKLQGWINLFKPKGISSFSAIYKIKKKFNIKKIGHAGTLDPEAEGILPIAINKTTKLIPFVNISSKKYLFKIKWGEQTSTDDLEGEIINYSNRENAFCCWIKGPCMSYFFYIKFFFNFINCREGTNSFWFI